MDTYAAAYLRRSVTSKDSPGDASREAQEAAVRSLCGDDVRLFVDWGFSGRNAERPQYLALKAEITAGRVGSVCAYSLSRLGRNAREVLAFVELCQGRDVPIQTKAEGLDTSSAFGRAMLGIMAVFAQLELEQGQERSAAAREARRAKAEAAGVAFLGSVAPYGFRHVRGADGVWRREPDPAQPLGVVLDAYTAAGSVQGACRQLEKDEVPAPNGGKRWGTSTLTRIIEANAAGLLPRRTISGRRPGAPSAAPLAHLIECPFCPTPRQVANGRTAKVLLTPNVARGQYYCRNGAHYSDDGHDRKAVREAALLPFVLAEARRLAPPIDVVEMSEKNEAARADLQERRRRLGVTYNDLSIDQDEYERGMADLKAREGALADREVARVMPDIDWDSWDEYDPAVLNTALRTFLHHIELDESFRPVEAVWRVPEWRADNI